MAKNLNWIHGDVLRTHNMEYKFAGQHKGRLHFVSLSIYPEYHLIESPKIVNEMVELQEWIQYAVSPC